MLSEKSIFLRVAWRFAPIVLVLVMVVSGYWAIYWEMFVWKKTLVEAFSASLQNWIFLFASVFLLFLRFFSGERKSVAKGSKEDDLWKVPVQKKEDKGSFGSYMKEQVQSFDERTRLEFGVFGKKKLHMRFLRQGKRLLSSCLFFLYLVMGVIAVPNPMSLLFFVTAFLQLDYLWKSRRASFTERKEG